MLDELDAAGMKRIVPSLLSALDALMRVDPTILLGAPKMSWADQLLNVDEETERVSGWHDRMAASALGVDAYRRGLAFLKDRVDSLPDHNHVVHNDLLHFNVFVSDGQITGVIDWGNAIRGDFLYDLAMFTFYKPWYPAMAEIDWLGQAKHYYDEIGIRLPDGEERMRCYEVHLGLAGIAYGSFKENWVEVEANANRLLGRI